jgi:hypothetical protein
MEASCAGYQFGPPRTGANAGGCILVLLLVLFVVACIWMCAAQGSNKKIVLGDAQGRDMRCGIPESEAARPAMSPQELRRHATETFVRAPVPNAGSGINNSIGRVPFTPNLGIPTPDEMFGSRAMAGGTPYQAGAFAPSDASAEFYATFQPSSLSSMMPANWRPSGQNCGAVAPAQAGASPVDTNFDEFSRYTVSPSQVQKAETLRGTIRLAELTSTRNSRTLGEPSLLRNAVTPLSPVPIGSNAFVFNDSSQRQGFIASATGRYPDEISC